jgi:signal transduction histidine kinase
VNVDGMGVRAKAGGLENVSLELSEAGCRECHRHGPGDRPRTAMLPWSDDVLRISTPVENAAGCQACHVRGARHLGVLLMDVSLAGTRARLLGDLRTDLALSICFLALVTAGVYLLIHRLVVRRVEQMEAPLNALAQGDYSARLPQLDRPRDELDALAQSVNALAAELERRMRELEEKHRLRYHAILEERERIAREMHDGMAQVMGYVNAKSAAIGLILEQGRAEEARQQLGQLAEASMDALLEIRTSIFGLRTAAAGNNGLCATLQEYAEKFSEMSGLRIDLLLPEAESPLGLGSETELHLLRIVQEALTNVRKHAGTDQAAVRLTRYDHTLEVRITDQGRGFPSGSVDAGAIGHFGLSTMRERAEAVGGSLAIDSEPGGGTCVTVRLPLNGA